MQLQCKKKTDSLAGGGRGGVGSLFKGRSEKYHMKHLTKVISRILKKKQFSYVACYSGIVKLL